MKLSTRGRYGLRAMFRLALCDGGEPVPLNAVAQAENIPEAYLEQLMPTLKKAGLVRSVRGAQGGYVLARSPNEISVGDILRPLEGDFAPSACMSGDGQDVCAMQGVCTSRIVWERLKDGINEVMDGITLSDMLSDYDRLKGRIDGDDIEHIEDIQKNDTNGNERKNKVGEQQNG